VPETLTRIEAFIGRHHVMTLATSRNNQPQTCNLFYAYIPEEVCFIVASDEKTEHIQNVLINPDVAGTIVLETRTVGKIEGLQFKAKMMNDDSDDAKEAYFKAFPYARVLSPSLWKITPLSMKLTDNRLGFGKKLNWMRDV